MSPSPAQFEDALKTPTAARYADIRYTATQQQHVKVRNGEVDHLSATVDRAVGVRVLVGNGWGFAATSDVSEAAIRRTAKRALEVAAASNIASTADVVLSEIDPHVARGAAKYEIDPWSVPLGGRLGHLPQAPQRRPWARG